CVRLYPESAHKMFDLVHEGVSIYVEYEPITVGKREGRYFLSVCPDIYHHNLVSIARANAILKKDGLLSRVNGNEVARIVRSHVGYPQPLHLRTSAKGIHSPPREHPDAKTQRKDVKKRARPMSDSHAGFGDGKPTQPDK